MAPRPALLEETPLALHDGVAACASMPKSTCGHPGGRAPRGRGSAPRPSGPGALERRGPRARRGVMALSGDGPALLGEWSLLRIATTRAATPRRDAGSKAGDPLHANSQHPVGAALFEQRAECPGTTPEQFLVSLRNVSALVTFDPATGSVGAVLKGPFVRQPRPRPHGGWPRAAVRQHGRRGRSRALAWDPLAERVAWSWGGPAEQRLLSRYCGNRGAFEHPRDGVHGRSGLRTLNRAGERYLCALREPPPNLAWTGAWWACSTRSAAVEDRGLRSASPGCAEGQGGPWAALQPAGTPGGTRAPGSDATPRIQPRGSSRAARGGREGPEGPRS